MIYERKVYYHETDQMGVVHHSNYFKWLEEARVYFLDIIGLNYRKIEENGIICPVTAISAKYIKPAHFDDDVLILLNVLRYTGIKFELSYEIRNKKTNELLARATSEHCFIRDNQILRLKNDCVEIHNIINKYLEHNLDIVLMSKSPRRKELLEKMGYKFAISSLDIDETFDPNLSIYDNVRLLSYTKASANLRKYYDKVLIGSDTIVVLDDKVYGKPKNRDEAYNMLKSLSGKMHKVLSGLCVIYKGKLFSDVCESHVYFKELSDKDIWDYIDTNEPFDKAGGYAIQGIGNKLVNHYEGSLNNIIGLPTEMLKEVLDNL